MLIIKLSTDVFKTKKQVKKFFEEEIGIFEPHGQFNFTRNKIADKNLYSGELLLFTFQSEVVYLAQSASDRYDNQDSEKNEFPYSFLVNLPTIRSIDIPLREVEKLMNRSGDSRQFVKTQAWLYVEDSSIPDKLWTLLGENRDNYDLDV